MRSKTSSSWTCTRIFCATTPASPISSRCAPRSARPAGTRSCPDKEQTIDDLKYDNYVKEMFLDSDTKIVLISSAPSDIEQDWFLTNEQMAAGARQGEQALRLAPAVRARHLHARPAGLAGQGRRRARAEAGIDEGLHHRRQHPQGLSAAIRGAWTTRRSPTRATRNSSKPASRMSACTRACSRRRSTGNFPNLRGLCRCQRRRPGGEGLAAAQFHHLSRRLSPRRRRSEGGAGGVRADRPHFLDQRSRRHPGAIRRQQRLCRRRPVVRHDADRRAAASPRR